MSTYVSNAIDSLNTKTVSDVDIFVNKLTLKTVPTVFNCCHSKCNFNDFIYSIIHYNNIMC